MAVATAGPCASLHLTPDRHPTTQFFTGRNGRMPFLPPNQQRQSTEGNKRQYKKYYGEGKLFRGKFILILTSVGSGTKGPIKRVVNSHYGFWTR